MRYRQDDLNGDYVFVGASNFLTNTPEAVAQAVGTRLRLLVGEWFLDQREGLDHTLILGYGTQATRDREIQQRILGTRGVLRITQYSSSVDTGTRAFRVNCTITTAYGEVVISEVLQ